MGPDQTESSPQPDINAAVSSERTPNNMEAVAKEAMGKLEQKNAELSGRLLVPIGPPENFDPRQGYTKTLIFPTPLEHPNDETSSQGRLIYRYNYLILTSEGFKVGRSSNMRLAEHLFDLNDRDLKEAGYLNNDYDDSREIRLGQRAFSGDSLIDNPDEMTVQTILEKNLERATKEHQEVVQKQEEERRRQAEIEEGQKRQIVMM